MTSEDNKDVVRAYLECWNDRNTDGLAEVMADDVHVTGLPGGQETEGVEAYQAFASETLEGFSDLNWTVDDIIAENDRVAAVVTATGTHDGEFMGIDATGAEMHLDGNLYFRISDGKIERKWNRTDDLGLLQQIGVLPEDLSAMAVPAND